MRSGRCQVSRALPAMQLVALLAALAAAFVAAPAAQAQSGPQLPATVAALLDGMAPIAHLPGKKDIPANFDVFRIGYALWDTHELAAGYDGAVAELIKKATTPGLLPSQHYLAVDAQVGCSLPYLTSTGAIHPQLQAFHDVVMDSPFSRFDSPADLVAALGTPGLNLLATQNTIFSPVTDAASGAVTIWTYPGLANIVAHFPPPTAWPGVRLIQNIGFANNPGFPIGDYDFAFEHPLVTKPGSPEVVTGSDALPVYVASDVVDDIQSGGIVVDEGLITKLFYFLPLSMLHPEVAALLRQSIQERVNQFADGSIEAFSVGGEFSFSAPPKDVSPPGCTTVDTPCTSGSTLSTADTYFCHLPNSDYSQYSLDHFRSWLTDKYGTLGALKSAWNASIPGSCYAIAGCPQVSPLAAVGYHPLGGGPVKWPVILADWLAFQDDQLRAARVFQYVAAKAARPDRPMYLYEASPRGADEAAQLSDGVSLGTFLPATTPLDELPSRLKKIALHGAAYGEAVNFPLFGMKQDTDAGFSGPPQDWPTAFLPATFDENHSRRMLHEFLTLGVNAVGLAYLEAIGNWNIKDGLFTHDCPALPGLQDLNMAQCLGAEVAAVQQRLAFMTPWRSPLLVDTGSWAGTQNGADINDYYPSPPLSTLLSVLADEQVQFAPFAEPDGLDDLWLPATRQVLMVAFLPELDAAAVQADRAWATAHGMHLLLLMDGAQESQLHLASCMTVASPGVPFHIDVLPVDGQPACGTPLVHAAFVVNGAAADVSPDVLRFAVHVVDLLVTRPLRPVRAESSPGVLAHGVDVNVSTDGLNLLVNATNTSSTPQTFTLVPAAPGFTYSIPDGASPPAPLAQSESLLRYVRADIPPNAIPSLTAALNQAVAGAAAAVTNLATQAPVFDTRAAQQLLLRLGTLSAQDQPEKVLAGLLRLHRMPFIHTDVLPGNKLKVTVAELDRTPIGGAPVQLEFALQQHARRNGVTATGNGPGDAAAGTVTLSIAKPADTVWDFTIPGKTIPAPNLVEVEVQHPLWFSQAATLVGP